MAEEISILSLNVRGLGDKKKRTDVLNFLKQKKISIYCLQDTHWVEDMENEISSNWNGKCFFSHKSSQARGVAILLNKNLDCVINNTKKDPNGNFLAIDIKIEDLNLTLISLYGPNEDSPSFFDKINNIIVSFDNPHSIICGDWNLTQNQCLDNYNYVKVNNPKARCRVLTLKEDHNLVDPWRIKNPISKRFTWRRSKPIKQARLDFFLTSNEFTSIINKADILPGYRTDHSMITLYVDLSQKKRGRGYWKFNNSLLSDHDYINLIREKISSIKKQYAASPYNPIEIDRIPISDIQFIINDQLFLEVLLMEIRGTTISFASYKKKCKLKLEIKLQEEINELENIMNDKATDQIDMDLKLKKENLVSLRRDKMEGHMIRSKVNLIENDEKPSKYFLNLKKRNNINKTINNLVLSNGFEISTQEDILEEIKRFYENLYNNKDEMLD